MPRKKTEQEKLDEEIAAEAAIIARVQRGDEVSAQLYYGESYKTTVYIGYVRGASSPFLCVHPHDLEAYRAARRFRVVPCRRMRPLVGFLSMLPTDREREAIRQVFPHLFTK